MFKSGRVLITLAFVMMFVAGCGGQKETGKEAEHERNFQLVKEGQFTFAASGEYRPFSFIKNGKMVGYDIAVGKAIADVLGLEANPVRAKFSGIVTGVKQGRYDAAVASHTITAERKEHVDFSIPYYYSGPQIFVRPGSSIQTKEDLIGKEIAVSKGSTYYDLALKLTSPEKIQAYDSDVVALQSLAKGRHDAVITDAITGQKAISSGLEIVGRAHLGISKQAVAVAKENDRLLEAINKALKQLKQSGRLAEISKKWIGADITKPPE